MSERTPRALDRRAFVRCTGAVAGLFALGGAAAIAGRSDAVRPPGAQDEARLLSLCTRCDRCRSACPTDVIAPAVLEDGLVSIRTPKLDFTLGWCDFCGACARACPTGALSDEAGRAFEFEGLPGRTFHETDAVIGRAAVNRDRCIIWRGQSTCTACSQACPYEAILLDEAGRPTVDERRCNGCGVCEHSCPSSRLLSYDGGSARGIEIAPVHGERPKE
ncbi:4Fe-4S dicluster domain-containing protein [Eggerthella sp. NSJ-70]|uniref:4Fe-4S dicluster domain-containing protein n=1 Tax=Eggerthella hominis TaxID=2763043 RepID=A0ABR7BNP9_9ACTN|nr:4Fe-4S dicluster domain-containing protein [Eggerthella hominis]MBC5583214.1 4Fe-4S dicluster domain-containing protein [Eggerthella hominis]